MLLPAIIGSIALVVLLVIGSVRLAFSALVCLDPLWEGLDPWSCIKASWRITGPYVWPLFVVALAAGLIAAASVLLLGVGVILLGWPLSIAIMGAAYTLIVEQHITTTCPACGAALPDPSAPCPSCGADLPGKAPGGPTTEPGR
jgi:hypothetical protein